MDPVSQSVQVPEGVQARGNPRQAGRERPPRHSARAQGDASPGRRCRTGNTTNRRRAGTKRQWEAAAAGEDDATAATSATAAAATGRGAANGRGGRGHAMVTGVILERGNQQEEGSAGSGGGGCAGRDWSWWVLDLEEISDFMMQFILVAGNAEMKRLLALMSLHF
ncbi:hypothetical protein EUGRSUZ_A02123 [Eucalyptus grandis]|uniref:Uncharacterized protein n=2 Tax=Eucalyptus grandis TaxID=71139 RepID=A0ACC3M5E1_EUCGR|nr:hypothetical protein EUGRSUZ_A02123 [Eucalyptus grandis]